MKQIRKFFVFLLPALLTLYLGLGCFGCGLRLYEYQYYIYTESYEDPTLTILGLTDLGREQEYLVIPSKIKGKKVVKVDPKFTKGDITEKYGSEEYWAFSSDKLKKIFVPDGVSVDDQYAYFEGSPNFQGVIYLSRDIGYYKRYHRGIYSFQAFLNILGQRGEEYDGWIPSWVGEYYIPANLSYIYNYEEAPNNGYYWMDDYDGEKIGFIPEEPKRKGYTFNGWYKEAECINAWDFNEDTVPKKIYDEEKGYGYQETKLYAKWTENY